MRTIAFVTQKGGAGKSTLASNIAVAARSAGERPFIVDLDPVQSLVKWSRARQKPDMPVEHIPPDKLSAILTELEKKGVTLVVIDAPGGGAGCSEEAIRVADLCIIPARPNVFDLWAGEATRVSVRDKTKDCAFLLNQCPPAQQSARVQRGAEALQETGALLAPLVSNRVDYQEAVRLGLGVGELNPKGAAAREMRELWRSVESRLKGEIWAESFAKIEAAPTAEAEFCSDRAAQPPSELPTAPEPIPQSDVAKPFWVAPFWLFWQGWA